jgi:hypothetical protein
MKALNQNWITENHIDFEYKKYVLLAYLQKVSEHFTENKLYPDLSDLVEHYRNLKALKECKQELYSRFPERLLASDFEKFKLVYEKMVADDRIMQEVEDIIDFSIPQFEQYLKEGKRIYEFIEAHTRIFPVGITPINNEAGYIFLCNGGQHFTNVYSYSVTIFEHPSEKYRGVHVEYINQFEVSLTTTFEAIKLDLIKWHKQLPNPAAYVIESSLDLPFNETFLPVAKRTIMKKIANVA